MPVSQAVLLSLSVALILSAAAYLVAKFYMDRGGSVGEAVGMGNKRTYMAIELGDSLIDVLTLILAEAEGDLEFEGDKERWVYKSLLIPTIASVGSFVLELVYLVVLKRLGCRFKKSTESKVLAALVCFHLGFEDIYQAMMYVFVALSQAQDRSIVLVVSALVMHLLVAILKIVSISMDVLKAMCCPSREGSPLRTAGDHRHPPRQSINGITLGRSSTLESEIHFTMRE